MEAEPSSHSQTFDQVTVKSEAEPGSMEPPVASMIGSGEKRKRGRPPRGQSAAPRAPPLPKVTQEDEDVCFICFDGGSLVLCDKKGCPKAYHPTCIKRDEAFFRSKAKWNCGWHICSVCQKASHYMCYTCTYSLCKGCTMDADYVCVRGNMGFCSTCMRTIMMIENKDLANKELVQVDFDDKTSWEYLFKVYWVYLKERLSLTLNELTQAENPCKGVRSPACKRILPDLQKGVSNRNGFLSNTSCEQLESKDPKDLVEPPNKDMVIEENPINVEEKLSSENDASSIVCDAWASKELLDFVAHMKDGNSSMLSQFDVQELLLKYIKKNNLRDPLKKSQIICDLRLMNLFGKTRVGHIEMLKLLEFHFLIKEDLQKTFIPAGIIETNASHLDADENNKSSLLTNKNKQRKNRKRIEVRTPQNNLEEYAAIDVHNINLIYLRRNLMENLTQDEKFLEKVIGSVVRIRISSSDQKQDIYRLVQVVGTKKVAAAYKVGNRTVDVKLDVLNLNKKESIAIDSISNQDFSQDECRRLRQSIRCGLVKHLTVGDVQKKAMELLIARLDDSLEAEKLKLNHLRDRASEKGRKKDLRECVEKLQLLDTPEERQRRLSEIPEVHADAKMNPDYESEQDVGVGDKKQDEYVRSKHSDFGRSKYRQINGKRKVQDDGLINGHRGISQKRRASNLIDQGGVKPKPEVPVAVLATGSSPPANDDETEKLFYYRDPNGNIQGPFSMVQLRKWSTTGYFPPNMRIWRSHEQRDSVLLTDALSGQFPAAPHMLYNPSLQSKQIRPASDNQISDAKWNHGTEIHRGDRNQIVKPLQYGIAGTQLDDNNECRRVDALGSLSSGFSTPSYRHKEVQPKDLSPIGLKENKLPSIHTGARHPIPSSNNGPVVSNNHGVRGYGNAGSPLRSAIKIVDGYSGEKKSNRGHQSQSSGLNGVSLPINLNSTEMDLNSGSALANSASCEEMCNMEPRESLNLKVISQEPEFVADLKLQSLNPKVPPQASDIPSLPSPTPKIQNENQVAQIAESKQLQPGNGMLQDSDPSWSSGSSLVVGSTKLPDKIDDKGEHSPLVKASPCGDTCNTDPPSLKDNSQELEIVAAERLQSLNPKVPPQASDIPSLPSPTPEILNENQGEQIAESRQPQPDNGMFQDSGSSWSSGSSLVVASTQLPDKEDGRDECYPLANAGSCGETCNTEPHESLNSALKVTSQESEFVADLKLQSSNPNVPPQASDIPSLPSPTPKILNENQGGQIAERKQPQPGNGMFQDSGPSWGSGSSLVVGSTQLPDKADDRGEHYPLANAGTCGEMCNTEPHESLNSALKVTSQELEFVAAVKLHSLNPKVPPQASDIPSLPSATPEILKENQGRQIAESKQSQPGNGMFQDSGPSWCSGSSSVVGSTQLPDKTDDWGEHSPTPAKPIVEEWSSGLVSMSLLKQPEVVGDHATPASNDDTLVHNSPSHIASNVTSWHGVETIEFTTLGEESVSDLLDEVDAMESRRGLGSPTSTMRYGDAVKGFKNDCFFIDDLSLTLDPRKGDAWSSTGDIQVSFQSIARKDTCGVQGSEAYDPLKRSSRHSSTSSDGETRSADFSHNQAEACLASHPCSSRDTFQGLKGTTMPPENRLEVLENAIKKTRDHMNLAVEPSAQGVADVDLDTNQGTGPGTISGYGIHQWDGHRRYGVEEHPNSRDWDSQVSGEVEYCRDRLLGNRQPLGGGGGGFLRPPLKGQHVCKFYENGQCKKGASCGYLHP